MDTIGDKTFWKEFDTFWFFSNFSAIVKIEKKTKTSRNQTTCQESSYDGYRNFCP